jgi:hypothetical protein
VGLRARGRAGGWADGAEGGEGGEDCGRLRPWRRRLLASMALSWPSAVRLAVAAVLLAAVVVALFTLPVEKVRPYLISIPLPKWAPSAIPCCDYSGAPVWDDLCCAVRHGKQP